MGEFRREVIPLLQSGTGHPAQIEDAMKRGMQQGKPTCSAQSLKDDELIDSPDGPDNIESSGHRTSLAGRQRKGYGADSPVRISKSDEADRRSGTG